MTTTPAGEPTCPEPSTDAPLTWRSLALALALHIVLVAALIWVFAPSLPDAQLGDEVALVSLPPAAPPPPPPEPQADRPELELPRPDRTPPMRVKPRTPPSVPPSDIEPLPVPAAPSPPPPPKEPARPEPPREAPAAPAATTATFTGLIMARLDGAKRYPTSARARGEEGSVGLRFTMDRAGHVLDAAVTISSGSDALDREALATLRRAQPLPTIPADLPDPLMLNVAIEFSIEGR